MYDCAFDGIIGSLCSFVRIIRIIIRLISQIVRRTMAFSPLLLTNTVRSWYGFCKCPDLSANRIAQNCPKRPIAVFDRIRKMRLILRHDGSISLRMINLQLHPTQNKPSAVVIQQTFPPFFYLSSKNDRTTSRKLTLSVHPCSVQSICNKNAVDLHLSFLPPDVKRCESRCSQLVAKSLQ